MRVEEDLPVQEVLVQQDSNLGEHEEPFRNLVLLDKIGRVG